MKLALDHHYPTAIAEQVRIPGHDVVAAVERGWHRESDEGLLALCVGEQRTLLTNAVGDFMVIVRGWATQGRRHAGLIFTSDAALPRTRGAIDTYVKLLEAYIRDHPNPDELIDHIHWL